MDPPAARWLDPGSEFPLLHPERGRFLPRPAVPGGFRPRTVLHRGHALVGVRCIDGGTVAREAPARRLELRPEARFLPTAFRLALRRRRQPGSRAVLGAMDPDGSQQDVLIAGATEQGKIERRCLCSISVFPQWLRSTSCRSGPTPRRTHAVARTPPSRTCCASRQNIRAIATTASLRGSIARPETP